MKTVWVPRTAGPMRFGEQRRLGPSTMRRFHVLQAIRLQAAPRLAFLQLAHTIYE